MRRSPLQPILALLLVLTVSVLPVLETDNTTHQEKNTLVETSISNTSRNSTNYTSNLTWGPNSGLNAFAAVDTPLTMSINITNGANVSDAVDFTPVYFTHLTLPTTPLVSVSVVARLFKKHTQIQNNAK